MSGDTDESGIIIGGDEKAEGSIAFGNGNTITGKQSIAVGTGHEISGNNSGAFGDPSYIKDDNAYAIGNNNTIEEGSANTFIVGNNVTTTAENTVVFGHHTENNAHTFGQNSVSLGTDAQATIGDSVALGSTSVAKRAAANGGAGAGYDVRTGTNYAEEDAKSPTWVSTLGTVSVGGTEKDTDADIGSAATSTRQITGVAAGTADTDAVNVAQLKLAVGGTTYTEGDNITIDENNVISATDTTYTATQSVEPGEKPGEGSTTLIIRDSNKDEKNPDGTPVGSMTIEAGDNITITEGDDNKAIISATDTTYNYNVTEDGLEEGQVSKLTIVNNVTGETVGESVDTNTHASVVGKGAVTVEMTKEATATSGPEYTVSLDTDLLKDTTYTAEQSVTAGENPGEGSTTFTITDSNGDEAGSMTVKAGDKVTITEAKDEKGNSIAVINATDTTYKISEEAGEEGSNVVNNYTMTGTNGDEYKEIIELREEVAELKALVYDLTGKGGLDPSKTAVFPDTPENHWAYDYVAVLAGNGVLEGYQDGYFKGNRQLTRYEMAAIIYRLMSKGIEVDNRMLQEFAPELARVKVDTLTHYNDGTPHIQRVRIIPQRG